jgi:hypothetical protein
MFYGNSIFKQEESMLENCDIDSSPISPVYESICTEYNNRLIMHENCTDEYDKLILEAQLEVLYELSIKEIWGKIKEWITKKLLAIVKWLEKLFSEGKKTQFKDFILGLLNQAKKLLGEVEEAETKEDVENCKEKYDSFSNEYANKMETLAQQVNSYKLNDGDENSTPDLTQDYEQFAADVIDVTKRIKRAKSANEAKDKDEPEKLTKELQNREEQHKRNTSNWKTRNKIKSTGTGWKGSKSRYKKY